MSTRDIKHEKSRKKTTKNKYNFEFLHENATDCKSYNSNRITWALEGTINLFCNI